VKLQITQLDLVADSLSVDPGVQLLIAKQATLGGTLATAGVTLMVAVPGSLYGPTGPTGATGPQGPAGPLATTYTFVQNTPQTVWTITHDLARFPSTVVIDSAGNIVEGDVDYISANQLVISFTGAFSGEAYLN